MLAGENLKTATSKRVKQVLSDMPSQNSLQSGAGLEARKRKAQQRKKQFVFRQETENISAEKET